LYCTPVQEGYYPAKKGAEVYGCVLQSRRLDHQLRTILEPTILKVEYLYADDNSDYEEKGAEAEFPCPANKRCEPPMYIPTNCP
jgi:hypothetical protein